MVLSIATFGQFKTTTGNDKFFDGIYAGASFGVTNNLLNVEDFDSYVPGVTLLVGKQFTQTFGIELNGSYLKDNWIMKDFNKFGYSAFVNTTYNINRIIGGKVKKPNWIEAKAIVGIGFLGTKNIPDNIDMRPHSFAKTAIDIDWNLGNSRAITLFARPEVNWMIDKGYFFNADYAYATLNAGIKYNFKNSNGHRYLSYEWVYEQNYIDKLNNKINELRDSLKNQPTIVVTDTIYVEVPKVEYVNKMTFVNFEQNSSTMGKEWTAPLDLIPEGTKVTVVGSASPEGKAEYNKELSRKRADVVADYLRKRGVIVNSESGIGAPTKDSQRQVLVVAFEGDK